MAEKIAIRADSAMVERMAGVLVANPEAIEAGKRWYPVASACVEALRAVYAPHLAPSVAQALFAVLSQQKRPWQEWRLLRDLWRLDAPIRHLPVVEGKVARILTHHTNPQVVNDAVRGSKIRDFWSALRGDPFGCPIDRWIWRAAEPELVKHINTAPTGTRYAIIRSSVVEVARMFGIAPADAQAAVWCAVNPADDLARMVADAQGMGLALAGVV